MENLSEDKNNSCDCCLKGWNKLNKFGNCVCWCSKCGNELRICKYNCYNNINNINCDDINDIDDNDDEMEEYYYKLNGCYYNDYIMEQQKKEVEETKIEHNKNKERNQPGGPNKYTK